MATFTSHNSGTFCWTDLQSTDQNAAKQFYSSIFGWSSQDIPFGEGEIYSMMMVGDRASAAISAMNAGMKAAGTPPHWSSFIAVDDVNAATAKAASLGAAVVMPATDVMDAGRMSMIQDPTGAYVALWKAGNSIGAQVLGEAGSVCWNELLTNDVAKAGEFYAALFGWTITKSPMPGGMDYTIAEHGGKQVAGIFAIDPAWGPVPSNWLPYFAVSDADATAAQIKSLGGNQMNDCMDIPGVGRFATCSDPQGAVFAILGPNKS